MDALDGSPAPGVTPAKAGAHLEMPPLPQGGLFGHLRMDSGFRRDDIVAGGLIVPDDLGLLHQADDGDLPAGLAMLMGGVAVREIAVGMAIGAVAHALDAGDAGPLQFGGDEAWQVEVGAAAVAGGKMPPAIGPQLGKVLHEMGAHLIILA